MNDTRATRPERILVIGRSPSVILDTAERLRAKGFQADATNQFGDVLTDYPTESLDVVVFGGMVPTTTKRLLTEEITKINSRVTFVQGLAGIAGLIAAQVEGAASTAESALDITYQPEKRSVAFTLFEPAGVVVEAWWATSFKPPEPTSTSQVVLDECLDAGAHEILLPAEVPAVASFVTVSVGETVRAFTVGAMPQAVMRMVPRGDAADAPVLPTVTPVATHSIG